MQTKNCNKCNSEEQIKDFIENYADYKNCNVKKVSSRYNDIEDKISNQRKIYYEKSKDKTLRKQKIFCMNFQELVRTYVELDNRLKALEEKAVNFDWQGPGEL